jgi:hypothetical protein
MSADSDTTARPGSNFVPRGIILTAVTKDFTNCITLASSMVEKELSIIKKQSRIRTNPE